MRSAVAISVRSRSSVKNCCHGRDAAGVPCSAAGYGKASGTGLAIFFVPIFFVVVRGFFHGSERQNKLYRHELDREMPSGATAGDQI